MTKLTRAAVTAAIERAEETVQAMDRIVQQDPGANRRRLDALVEDTRKKLPASHRASILDLELGALPTIEKELRAEHDRAYDEAHRGLQAARSSLSTYEHERRALPLEAPTPPPGDLSGYGDVIAELRGLRFDAKLDRLERQYASASLPELYRALEAADAEDHTEAAWLERQIEGRLAKPAAGKTPAELAHHKGEQKRIAGLLEARQAARLTEADRHALAEWRVRLADVDAALSRAGLTVMTMRQMPSMSIAKIAKRNEGK